MAISLQIHRAAPVVHHSGTSIWVDVPISDDRTAEVTLFLTPESAMAFAAALQAAAERVAKARALDQVVA